MHASQLGNKTAHQALILLKNRGAVTTVTLVPLFFRLFRVNDKPLRQLLFRHIISDIKQARPRPRARMHELAPSSHRFS